MTDVVLGWLLDSDPSIRWQVLRDLVDATSETVAAERSRVADEGWGARLLELQGEDGNWGGGPYTPKWTSTTYTLLLLRRLGIDPDAANVRTATDLVAERVEMGRKELPLFQYVGETCISAMCLALNSYFRHGDGAHAEWLLGEQLDDGGWNCDTPRGSTVSSFNTTISALEALLEYERSTGGDSTVTEARARAHEYLLERKLMYRLSDGELISKRWLLMSFPPRWHYDVLRGLDYLADAGVAVDERWDEAIEVVRSKRSKDGTWPLQNPHPGEVHFDMEDGAGKPSRWNTLRAMRVLRRHDSD